MNKNLKTLIKTGLHAIVIAGVALSANAQKLPDVQEGGLWAEGIKVDGRVTEWAKVKGYGKVAGPVSQLNDAFSALNRTTNLYYTLANDDKNLYLLVKAASTTNNFKIMAGGVTLAINTEGKKKDKEAFQVTFPFIVRTPMTGGGGPRPMGAVTVVSAVRIGGATGAPSAPDSAMIAEQRKRQIATMKDLKLSGFKGVPDTISIYNEFGLKAAANYDDKGLLMYELAIPLELMGLTPANAKEFAYNIKVNGMSFGPMGGVVVDGAGGGGAAVRVMGGSVMGGSVGFSSMSDHGSMMQDMQSATDFWGKYALAKKE